MYRFRQPRHSGCVYGHDSDYDSVYDYVQVHDYVHVHVHVSTATFVGIP
jgi:hypothetical protein